MQGSTSRTFLYKYFFGVPHLATCILVFFYNEPEFGVEIDPGMALTPWFHLALDRDRTQDLPIEQKRLRTSVLYDPRLFMRVVLQMFIQVKASSDLSAK